MNLRFENPVLTKELRTRMRGARAYWILFVYLFVLSLILFFSYLSWWQSQRNDIGGDAAFSIGKAFYMVLFVTQGVLVGLITPALTAGSISIEREQRTYELLSASLLPRRSIVVGKLASAASFVGLLLTSSLPLVSLCFLLGGVSPAEVFASYILLLVAAFLYGAVGVAWSAISRRTSTATVLAYGTILFLFMATLPLAVANIDRPFGGAGFGAGLGAVNPIGAVLAGSLNERYFALTLPAWVPAVVLNGLLGVLLVVVAVHRLEYPASDRSALLRLLSVLFLGLLAFFVYGCLLPVGGGRGILGMANIQDRLLFASVVTLLGAMVWVPIFVTGDGLPVGGVFSGLDPRRWLRGEAPSGLIFALLLVCLCGAILLIGAPNHLRPRVVNLVVLTAAVTFGFGAFGLLFSALLENRWSALAVTIAAMTLLYLVPLGTAVGGEMLRGDGRIRQGRVLDNAIYLSPIPAAITLSDPAAGRREQFRRFPWLWGGLTPFHIVTSALYTGMGVVLLSAAGAVHASRRRRQETARAPAAAVPTT